jgi:hypothetical protein
VHRAFDMDGRRKRESHQFLTQSVAGVTKCHKAVPASDLEPPWSSYLGRTPGSSFTMLLSIGLSGAVCTPSLSFPPGI